MTREQLEEVAGIALAAPADPVALAVADALLPAPLPPALRSFLVVCDGARAGGVEVFDAERITESTGHGAHSWQLPADTLVIGTAGPGRALIMTGGRDEVHEVDDDPWDARTVELAADTPLNLFVRHRGMPLKDRPPWSAVPGLGAGIDTTRTTLARVLEALLDTGIGVRAGAPLPSSLSGFQPVDLATGARLLTSEEYQTFLVNYRPRCPVTGSSARMEWERACEAIVTADLRDRVRAAPVSAVVDAVGSVGDDELTMADIVRELVWLVLLGWAREELARLVGGDDRDDDAPLGRLAHVLLAGHVPVSRDAAM